MQPIKAFTSGIRPTGVLRDLYLIVYALLFYFKLHTENIKFLHLGTMSDYSSMAAYIQQLTSNAVPSKRLRGILT